jgi:hypothetical protein
MRRLSLGTWGTFALALGLGLSALALWRRPIR